MGPDGFHDSPSSLTRTPQEELTGSRQSAHYAVLVLASIVGTLIRLGLDALANYDGSIGFPLIWAQGVGCGIMGLALGNKNSITSLYPPLHTAFTTGLAGSITTFSSWMLGGWQSFSNYDHSNRHGLQDTVDGLAYSFITFGISMASLRLGEHLSTIVKLPLLRYGHRKTPLLDTMAIALGAIAYLLALIIYFFAPHRWRHDVTFPILLAPPGAMLRYALSNLNTHPWPHLTNRFPLGTFLANMSATLILAGTFAASHSHVFIGPTRCNALYALQQGFCGCLSTVSTFCVEVRTVRGTRWKWVYVFGSVVLGHLFMLAVVGGVGWARDGGLGQLCTG